MAANSSCRCRAPSESPSITASERTRASIETSQHPDAMLMRVHALMKEGRTAEGLAQLREIEHAHAHNEAVQMRVAESYSRYGRHLDAQHHYRRFVQRHPEAPAHLFNLAASLQASGELDEAAALIERVIALAPSDYEAFGMRAGLRRQTPAANHVKEMEERLAAPDLPVQGEIHLCFALAKELEDLGDYAQSFAYLARGARRRRERLAYRVENDVAALAKIADVFDARFFNEPHAGWDDAGPIFITGLPRSGTTLVDRIVSSHSQVESLGEISDFAQSLTRLAGASGAGKSSLIEASSRIDWRALGEQYCRAARGYGVSRRRFIDKTPLNFLYIGLIHCALPKARILHLARTPMDACFAMYRTLFRMGYPFSYDFDDLARYYAAYRRLMAHWRCALPAGAFLDVPYEGLIEDQEGWTRRILDFCGLEFEPQCLAFHRNVAPVATASSVQVRRPINTESIARWRRYEQALAPLREKLAGLGVVVE